MNEYYFHAKGVSVGYHGKPVIRDMEICLHRGEILTLIGPNGAGKSTVLKSIAGQLSLVAGAVYLNQKSLKDVGRKTLARKLAVVLTEKIRGGMMTCEDVAATGRYPYTGRMGILTNRDRLAVEEAMDLVHVKELRRAPFDKISDGQRQRVMLARALCQEPEIILLDEPTSFLDIRYKLEFLSMLQEMKRKKGLTVIMSLHELDLAQRISDKILCLDGEYAQGFGSPEEIFAGDYIGKLFHIEQGSFDEENTSMELKAPEGEPEVFVIGGGGSARQTYRRLQREGIPFATGILFENDLDYPVAKALAVRVIGAKAFEPVPGDVIIQAKEQMARCREVICCREKTGTFEEGNRELLGYWMEKRGL